MIAGQSCSGALLLCLNALWGCLEMTKYLLWFALVVIVVWLWRKSQATPSGEPRPPAEREPEAMVKCSHCGVNQPLSESTLAAGRYYCCAAHRQAAESESEGS